MCVNRMKAEMVSLSELEKSMNLDSEHWSSNTEYNYRTED
jgi:hypothetical protein